MRRIIQTVAVVALTSTALAAPKLVFTEIMYDPVSSESDEKQTEWVEIQNQGASAVNLAGYQLTSGTKVDPAAARQKYVFRDLTLQPGQFLLIGIGSAASYQGLGLPAMDVYCDESRYAWLTNTGDSIALRDPQQEIVDQVIYSSDTPWPAAGRSGGSIQFVAPAGQDPQLANDDGKNWVASGPSNSKEFPGHGRGTPGAATIAPATQPARR